MRKVSMNERNPGYKDSKNKWNELQEEHFAKYRTYVLQRMYAEGVCLVLSNAEIEAHDVVQSVAENAEGSQDRDVPVVPVPEVPERGKKRVIRSEAARLCDSWPDKGM